ncbi:hypothetical protein CKO51_25785 [Rhodopirellula sp. SM50]|nr:FkbM family methyltransferase [Rhodopirellula sp. SM50]PAY16590.1 hypothetical protein CKO51_25785 [Rhodopirellula sp. SM50]
MTSRETMMPESYIGPPLPPPQGNVISRGLRAICLERRLPYQLVQRLDPWLLKKGLRYKTMRCGNATMRIRRCSADDRFVQNVLLNNDYNPAGYEIHPTDNVIDVGGQIGSFAVYAGQRATQGRVFTYEPTSENFALLTSNLRRNRLSNVKAEKAAVLGVSKPVRIFLTQFTGGHSIIEANGDSEDDYEDVPGVSLESIFRDNEIERCQFLKMDCEGAEFDIVLKSSDETLQRVDRVAMEWHASSKERKVEESQQLVVRLLDLGFEIDRYVEFTNFTCGFIFARRRQ